MPEIAAIQTINRTYPAAKSPAESKHAVIKESADSFEGKGKNSVTGEAAVIGATSALVLSALKMPSTVTKVFKDFKGQGIPKNVKIAGIAAGSAIATAAYTLAGTGIGSACGKVIDTVNNNSKKENPVADNERLSAEVSDTQSERPALIDGDFEPENEDETDVINSDITAEGA